MPVLPYAVGNACGHSDAQLWQIGSAICLLALKPASALTANPIILDSPLPKDYPAILVCDYVSNKLGATLRAQGVYYADAVGNAWFKHPKLLVSVQGCPQSKVKATVVSPANQVHLLRLLFQLLLEPVLATYSVPNIAIHTQLSPAVVRQALHSLDKLGLWKQEIALSNRLTQAASYWISYYAKTLRCRLNAQRYRPRDPAALVNWSQYRLPAECLWSGEVAAHLLLNKGVPPNRFTLYSQMPRLQLIQKLDLVPHSHGHIEILNAFVPSTFFAPNDARCVPPLLVYADLLASQKPHCAELAQQVWARYLVNLLPD
jgi:hypothetical protein